MKSVILYTTHCPKCNILKAKMDEKEICYNIIDDITIMQEKGFMMAPILEVNGECLDFKKAVDWVNNY